MGMFVEEEVVACGVFRDSQGQVFQLCRLGAGQPDQLLLSIYLLWMRKQKKLVSWLEVCACDHNSPCFEFQSN